MTSVNCARKTITLMLILIFSFIFSAAAHAKEVDFLNLPFGAKRSAIKYLFSKKSHQQDGRVYYLRKEKDMRFAGMPLYGVYYGFNKDRLVVVEARTFQLNSIKSNCANIKESEAIQKKIVSLFGKRIRHVDEFSPPETFRTNYKDYKECVDVFPGMKNVSCYVNNYEKWKAGAKKTDHALEATFQEISIGRGPGTQCMVRLIFRPGRLLSKKNAEEEAWKKDMDDLLGPVE